MTTGLGREEGTSRWLRLLAATATLLVLPVLAAAGHLHGWTIPVLGLAAVVVYARPDSGHGLAALAVVALAWVSARPASTSPWTLVVALLMFATHAALTLQTTAPPGTVLPAEVVTRWLWRSGLVAAATALVYVLTVALANVYRRETPALVALALGLLTGLVLLLRWETFDHTEGRPRRPVA